VSRLVSRLTFEEEAGRLPTVKPRLKNRIVSREPIARGAKRGDSEELCGYGNQPPNATLTPSEITSRTIVRVASVAPDFNASINRLPRLR